MVAFRESPGDQKPEHSNVETRSETKPASTASTEAPSKAPLNSPSGSDPVMIGDYRIIRKLGAGGMGIVYEAEQQHPKRLVALKVIQGARLLDDQTVKQFEREAQALARLKHPGIAAIHESGRTSEGQHFFVMELIRGETLDVYLKKSAKAGGMTSALLRDRLAIFREISDAITYAHQRGVIHRDLKPSNIVIHHEYDSSDSGSEPHVPGIKILDFGLARITETDLAFATLGTEIGKIQGTLPYMSPEQVRGNPDEIDVRSDVYSLGVILYEMIAGRRPYDVHHTMWHEAARIICEVPPDPLSKSWSGTKRLDKDIETIVGKALEKEASRRYQSVAALGEDISRFLTSQPILARPPSALYQLQKMAVRHKLGFAFAISLLVLIAAFSVGMSIQARSIANERDRANREAGISQQVSDFLISLFQVSDPFEGKGKDITAREILDAGSARIANELKDQPEIRAAMLDTMGAVYKNLGLFDKAIDLTRAGLKIREQKLGGDSVETAKSLNNLGVLTLSKGDYVTAQKLMREALEIRRMKLGPDSLSAAETLDSLASAAFEKGEYAKCEELCRQSLAIKRKNLGENSIPVSNSLNDLAMTLNYEDKLSESEALYLESIAIRRKLLGPAHPFIAQSLNNLGLLYLRMRNFSESEKLLQEALEINRKNFSEGHPEITANLNNLALVNLEWKRFPQAEELMRQVIAMRQKYLGENNSALGEIVQSLAVVLSQEKKYAEAEEYFQKAIDLKTTRFGENSFQVATTRNLLGACFLAQSKFRKAEPLLVQSYGIIKTEFGTKHDRTRRAGSRLVDLYNAMGKKEKAAAITAELGPAP
jgi:eukaryotic-like serine/threonine-protein kinase